MTRVATHARQRKLFRLHAEALLLRRVLPDHVVDRLRRGETVADEHPRVRRAPPSDPHAAP